MPAWICDGTNTDAYNLASVTNTNAVERRGKRIPVGTWGDRHQHGCKLLSRIFNGRRHGSPVCSRKYDGGNMSLGVVTHLDRLRSAGMKLCGKQPDQLAIDALHAFGNTIGRRLRDFDVPPFLRIAKQLKTNLHLLPNVIAETRAGERTVSPFELLKMLSGDGPCELRSFPARCLWRLDRLFGGLALARGRRSRKEICKI